MIDKPRKLITQGFLVGIEMEEWVDPAQVGRWMSGKLYALEGVYDVDVTPLGPVECLNEETNNKCLACEGTGNDRFCGGEGSPCSACNGTGKKLKNEHIKETS